jgi:hypothetical protein
VPISLFLARGCAAASARSSGTATRSLGTIIGIARLGSGAVLWLVSPYGEYIAGEVINVGGGMVL